MKHEGSEGLADTDGGRAGVRGRRQRRCPTWPQPTGLLDVAVAEMELADRGADGGGDRPVVSPGGLRGPAVSRRAPGSDRPRRSRRGSCRRRKPRTSGGGSWTSTSPSERTRFDLRVDRRLIHGIARDVLVQTRQDRFRRDEHVRRRSRGRSATRGRARRRKGSGLQPDPHRDPLPPGDRRDRQRSRVTPVASTGRCTCSSSRACSHRPEIAESPWRSAHDRLIR